MGTTVITNLLKWQVDQASLNKYIADGNKAAAAQVANAKRAADATTSTRQATEAYNTVLGKLGASASANLTILEQKFRDARNSTQRLRTLNEDVANSYRRIASEASSAGNAASRVSSAGAAAKSVQGIAGQAGGILSTIGLGSAGSAIASVAGLTASLGPFGLAAGIGVVAVNALTSEYERNAEAAKAAANQLKSNADLVASGATSSDVQVQIDRLKNAEGVAANQLELLAQYRDKLVQIIPDSFAETQARIRQLANRLTGAGDDKTFAAMNAIFQEISATTGLTVQDMAQLQAHISAVAGTSTEYTTEIANLNRLMLSGALAANDAAEAEQTLADRRKKNNDEILKAETARVKANEAYFAAVQAETNALQAHITNVLAIEAEVQQKTAELQANAEGERAENAYKAQQDRIKQELAYYKQVQDIQRKANATIANAVASRDAMAAYMALQAKAEELRGAKEANDERMKEIDSALKEQNRLVDKRLQEQLAAQRKAADDAIRMERDRYAKERQLLQQATQQAIADQRNADAALKALRDQQRFLEQSAAFNHSNSMYSIADHGATLIETREAQMWARRAAMIPGAGAGGGTGTGGIGGVPGFGSYASGISYVPYDQLAYLHKGERVVRAVDNMPDPRTSGRGGVTNNIYLSVDSREFKNISRQEALNVVGRTLEGKGA